MAIADAENKIRDIINAIRVMQREEDEMGAKKVQDDAAEELVEELEDLAVLVGQL